jgi:SAM-dependent methyltransferase
LTYLFHLAAYRFAIDYTSRRDVLDYGCGTGYGTALLAESATRVVGVDVDEAAVAHAECSHRQPNLSFRCVSPAESGSLPFDSNSFDTVVSFQVIEHISEVRAYLSEIDRLLRPGGAVLIATPDRTSRLFSFQKPWNRYHATEYSAPQLGALLATTFAEVNILGMTAVPPVVEIEMRRTRRLRWALLPFTLPLVPQALRQASLAACKAVSELRAQRRRQAEPRFDFDEAAIVIGPYEPRSVNLVAVCRKTGATKGAERLSVGALVGVHGPG